MGLVGRPLLQSFRFVFCGPGSNQDYMWEDGEDHTDNTLGTVSTIIIGVVLLSVSIIGIYIWWRRRKNHKINNMIRELEVKANKYEETEKRDIEAIKIDDWEIDKKNVTVNWTDRLGNGAFGTVYLGHLSVERLPPMAAQSSIAVSALERNNGKIAVKMLSDTENSTADLAFREEIELMKSLGFHERLVNMLACATHSSPTLLIVEFCSKGDLLRHMKKCREYMLSINPQSTPSLDYQQIITEKQQHMFALQIACGLEYLSTHGYVHRDIAARNILVGGNDAAKIGDFGLCRKLENDQGLYLTRGGRLPLKWMAPEALRHFEMSTASDVWSYGVLLFEIVTLGGSPYAGWTLSEVLPRLEAGERMCRPDCCPDSMHELMSACWRQRPNQRPSFTMIKDHLDDTLAKMNNDTNYLRLDSQQQYYHIGSEHDQSVPEDVIFRHIAQTQTESGIDRNTMANNVAALRENFSLFNGPIPLSAELLHITSGQSPDGYQLPISSPLHTSPNVFKTAVNANTIVDDGYQVPISSPIHANQSTFTRTGTDLRDDDNGYQVPRTSPR